MGCHPHWEGSLPFSACERVVTQCASCPHSLPFCPPPCYDAVWGSHQMPTKCKNPSYWNVSWNKALFFTLFFTHGELTPGPSRWATSLLFILRHNLTKSPNCLGWAWTYGLLALPPRVLFIGVFTIVPDFILSFFLWGLTPTSPMLQNLYPWATWNVLHK